MNESLRIAIASRHITTTDMAYSGVPIWPNSGVPGYATVNTPLLYAYQWRTRSYATDIWHLSVAYHLGTPLIYYWWRTSWYATDIFDRLCRYWWRTIYVRH